MSDPVPPPVVASRASRSGAGRDARLWIAEIFHSFQGEGSLTGVPSVFVRVAGCNLRCRWCDTPYASWEPQGVWMSVAEIVSRADRLAGSGTRHVVLTGGEPMTAGGIHALAADFQERGWHITIETAGTMPPAGIACDLASVSPKLAHSTPLEGEIAEGWRDRHESLRWQPRVVAEWVLRGDYQLKFVVATMSDFGEMESMLGALAQAGVPLLPWCVQVMPEGTSLEVLAERRTLLLSLCKERGYRFCERRHIEWFGNTPGT